MNPILAKSTYVKVAAKSLRNAANLLDRGDFEEAGKEVKLASSRLDHLEIQIAAMLKKPRG